MIITVMEYKEMVKINLENWQEFLALVENESYAAAADELYISQATLSRHIRDMENELGLPLFHRTSRKVQISRYGKLMLPYARKIVELQNDYKMELDKILKQVNGSLTIGVLPTVSSYGYTELIAEFQQKNPNISIQIIRNDSNKLFEQIKDRSCDFVFVREDNTDSNTPMDRLLLAADQLVVMLSNNHRLSEYKTIRLEQLKDEYFLLHPDYSLIYRVSVSACRKVGFEPHQILKGITGNGICDVVGSGLGVALLPKLTAEEMINYKVKIADIDPPIFTYVNLLYHKDYLGQTGHKFLQFVQNWLKQNKI